MALANKIAPISRKATRKAVASLIDDNVADLVETYDHETKDFGGRSPICMVYGDGTAPTYAPLMNQHALLISLWWRRDDDAATEDYLDDLSGEVRLLLKENVANAPNWSSMTIDDSFSSMDYPIVDGVMYRRETLRVTIW